MGKVKKLAWLYNNLEELVCGTLLCWIMSLLMSQVVYRYVFGKSLAWAEEVSRFSFLYMVYFAASLGVQKAIHIRVTAHLEYLPSKVRVVLMAITDCVWLVFNAFVIVEGVALLEGMATQKMVSAALMLDMRYVYLVLPLGFALQSIRIIENWFKFFKGKNKMQVSDGGAISGA
jgi:C4-dicarboxylate transporter DctQ subunit